MDPTQQSPAEESTKPEVSSQPSPTPPPSVSLPTESITVSEEVDEKKDVVPPPNQVVPYAPLPAGRTSTQTGAGKITAALPPRKPKRQSRFRPKLRSFIGTLVAILKIVFLYGIPGLVLSAIALVLVFGIPFGLMTAQGALVMVIGNSVLNAAHLAHYTTNAKAAAIGATGAILASMIIGIFMQCLPSWMTTGQPQQNSMWDDGMDFHNQQDESKTPWYTSIIVSVLMSTLAGTIGCAILKHNHVDLGGIDVLHATRAGAVGGSIVGVGMILLGPIILAVLGIILAPLWIAMSFGLKWAYARSNESWTQRGDWNVHSSSHCYCYGTCGGDDDIDLEINEIRQDYR